MAVSGHATAQKSKHGTCVGTATVSYAETEGVSKTEIKGEVKIAIPLTSRDANRANAELDDTGKPSATARITHYEYSSRTTSPDSSGKLSSWTCKLAAPIEVPMMAQGVLDIDYRKKTYTLSISLLAMKQLPVQCVNSRSGPYKENRGASLFLGTHPPGPPPAKGLPFTDPATLAASYKLLPTGEMAGRFSPIEQTWSFQLQP